MSLVDAVIRILLGTKYSRRPPYLLKNIPRNCHPGSNVSAGLSALMSSLTGLMFKYPHHCHCSAYACADDAIAHEKLILPKDIITAEPSKHAQG